MKFNNSVIRDMIIVGAMLLAAFYVLCFPIQKYNAGARINLSAIVPASFGDWDSVQYDMSDYKDKWQSINELILRKYTNKVTKEQLVLIVEYSSDLRKNFSIHFPEGCFRAAGDDVSFLPFFTIPLDNKILSLKSLYIRSTKDNFDQDTKIVSYWLVIDNKQYSRTFFIKLDQFFAGIWSRSKKGFLVRIDSAEGVRYNDEDIKQINHTTSRFIAALYWVLDEKSRVMLFGK
jgi:hypothetical protein